MVEDAAETTQMLLKFASVHGLAKRGSTGRLRWLLPLLLAALASPGCGLHYREQVKVAMRTPRQGGPARLEIIEGVPVVHVYGTNEEMAAQYGRVLKPALQALCGYADCLLPSGTKRRFIEMAAAREPLMPETVRRQLRAAAEAADFPYMDLVALNIVPRLMCTTLAVWGDATADGRLIMGRNADYFGLGLSDRGSLVVVYHPDEGVPVACVTFLGMLGGFAGINAEGVAFGNMLVFNGGGAGYRADGLPVQLAMRMAAQRARTVEDASRELLATAHAIPMNVMVADARKALLLELGVDVHHVRRGRDGVLAAANDWLAHPAMVPPRPCGRYQALLTAAERGRGHMTAADVGKALHAARIPNMNLQAIVFEPAAMKMHVSINRVPASAGPYVTLDLKGLFEE